MCLAHSHQLWKSLFKLHIKTGPRLGLSPDCWQHLAPPLVLQLLLIVESFSQYFHPKQNINSASREDQGSEVQSLNSVLVVWVKERSVCTANITKLPQLPGMVSNGVNAFVCVCVCLHVCVFVCVCACMCACLCVCQERIIERLKDQREREDRERLDEVESYKKENKDLKEKVNSLQVELTEKEVSRVSECVSEWVCVCVYFSRPQHLKGVCMSVLCVFAWYVWCCSPCVCVCVCVCSSPAW